MVRRASCSCGGISIKVSGDPALNAICHCDDCKRRTGSAFGWSAYFTDAQVLAREGAPSLRRLTHVPLQERRFCPDCGTMLWWTAEGMPGHVGVAAGAFVDAPLPEPNLSARHSQACDWVAVPEDWQRST